MSTSESHTTPDQPQGRVLVIAHSYAEGTTLSGTRRSDDLYRLLRSQGWLYRRSVGDFRLQGSVDKPAKTGAIDYTARSLRERGFTVRVDIDNTVRPAVEAEADRAGRAEERADRLDARAQRLGRQVQARQDAADHVLDNIPPGQPYLVDHHSYRADRARRERAFANLEKSWDLAGQADTAAARADTARRHMDYRHTPETVANRIREIEADLRRIDRERDQYRRRDDLIAAGVPAERIGIGALTPLRDMDLADRTTYLTEQLDYWRNVRAQQITDGTATNYTRDDIHTGDLVKYRGTWYPVVRVNTKSVSVPSIVGGTSWTDTVRYEHLRDHRHPNHPDWATARTAALAQAYAISRSGALHPAYAALQPDPDLPA